MGIWISRMMAVFGEKEARILVLGLDNAGKTTILCKLLALHLCDPHQWALHTGILLYVSPIQVPSMIYC